MRDFVYQHLLDLFRTSPACTTGGRVNPDTSVRGFVELIGLRGQGLPAHGVVVWLIGTEGRGMPYQRGLSRARTGGKCTSRYSRLDELTPVVFVAMGGS